MSNNTISQLKINNEIYDLFDARTYADIEQFKTDITNMLFPIGYIYMSTDSTRPSQLFGGTWEQIQDRFLLAAGDIYGAGNIGGTASHSHNLNSHTHDLSNHTHGLNNHTHDLSNHVHSYGLKFAAMWRSLVTLNNNKDDFAMIELHGQTNQSNSTKSDWNHETNAGLKESVVSKKPAIVDLYANTGTPSNNTSGGPSNNTSGGPSNNTSGGPSNNNTSSSSNMPPYLAVYMWKKIAN